MLSGIILSEVYPTLSSINHESISRVSANDGECDETCDDGDEPRVTIDVLPRYVYIHAPQTSYKIHRDKDRPERSDLTLNTAAVMG